MAQFYVTVDEDVMRAVFQEDGGYSFLDAYRRSANTCVTTATPRKLRIHVSGSITKLSEHSIKPKVFVA